VVFEKAIRKLQVKIVDTLTFLFRLFVLMSRDFQFLPFDLTALGESRPIAVDL
jgi:hypothetical protein